MSCVRTVDIAPYLLGGVSVEQRLKLEEHLKTCPMCRAEIVDLAGLPGLLWRASGADQREPRLEGPQRARHLKKPAPRRRLVTAIVAALAIVGGTVAGLHLAGGRPRSPVAGQPQSASSTLSATDPATRVSAAAVLTEQPWGTAIQLSLRGLPSATRCELVVHATDGSSDIAGTWNAAYTPRLEIPAATDIARARIASLEISTTGQHLITIPGHELRR